jgi:D-aminopeptidase
LRAFYWQLLPTHSHPASAFTFRLISKVSAASTATTRRRPDSLSTDARENSWPKTPTRRFAARPTAAPKKTAPQRTGPYRVTIQYRNFTFTEVAGAFKEIEVVAPDTLRFARDTMPEAYRLIRVLYRFINPD